MNALLAIPLPVRLALLAVLGAALGAAINAAVYAMSFAPIGPQPWLRRAVPTGAAWWRRIPIVGWFALWSAWRRERGSLAANPRARAAANHAGDVGFSWRPPIVELGMAATLPALYWWEVVARGLLPLAFPRFVPQGALDPLPAALHVWFLVHGVLLAFMLAASLIDLDERIIPDAITLPGTLLGLLFATLWPPSLLPEVLRVAPPPLIRSLTLASPNDWPNALDGAPLGLGLAIGLACWALWCFAVLPRTWYPRHGVRRAIQLSAARVLRQRATPLVALMAIAGGATIAAVWYIGGDPWRTLLTALVGMAVAGGLVWVVRIAAAAALRREAMGFGDVLLMCMIGAYLGWQPSLFVFFLAPVIGLVGGLLMMLSTSDREIPFGPFLCLAAAAVVLRWPAFWQWAAPMFAIPWLIPLMIGVCVPVLFALLLLWQFVGSFFRR